MFLNMDNRLIFVFIAFFISLIMGVIVIPNILLIAKRKKLFDPIDGRKEKIAPTPRLGGFAFFPISMFSFVLMVGMRYIYNYPIASDTEVSVLIYTTFLAAALLLIFFTGLADDLVEISFKIKFLVQALCAALIVFSGLYIVNFEGLLFIKQLPVWIAVPFTVVLIVYIVNAYNLIDGINGLCSGLGLVALLAFAGWNIYVENYVFAMLAMGVVGIVSAFFYFNTSSKRLRIFMGDTGSLTLGFIISFFAVKFIAVPQANPEFYIPHSPISLMIGLLFIPFFDTFRVFIGRLMKGKSPFHPDRTHIHHKLLNVGFTHIQSTIVIVFSQIGFLVVNVLLSEVLMLNVNVVLLIDVVMAIGIVMLINKTIDAKQKRVVSNIKQKI